MGKRQRALINDGSTDHALNELSSSKLSGLDAHVNSEKKKKRRKDAPENGRNEVADGKDRAVDIKRQSNASEEVETTGKKKIEEAKKKKKKKKEKDSSGKKKRTKRAADGSVELKDKNIDGAKGPKLEVNTDESASPVKTSAQPNSLSANRTKERKRSREHSKDLSRAEDVTDMKDKHGNILSDLKEQKDQADEELDNDLLRIPTIEEIFAHAAKKRDAYLHGYTSMTLPSGSQIRQLDDETKHRIITGTADLCERAMGLLHETIVTVNRWTGADEKDDQAAIEETLASDLIRLKKMPVAKQYVEMTLWKRSLELIRSQLEAASRLGFGKGLPTKGAPHQGLLLHRDDDPDAEFVSYREAYMKSIVERFSESLDKMRESENMDADRVQFLLRCLDSGASLFANLKCVEDSEHKARINEST